MLTVAQARLLSTASTASVSGHAGRFAISRYKRFTGRTTFLAHINAPLVVPEVITGLSLLLFFVACENLLGGARCAACWPSGSAIPRSARPMPPS